MKLIQVTDSHLLADKQRSGYNGICPYDSLQAVLALVRQRDPDYLLLTGDLSGDESADSYAHLHELLCESGLMARSWMIPGNHDDPSLMQGLFPQAMGWQKQSIEGEGWQVHGLNSAYQGTLGRVSQRQLDELVQRVEASPDTHHAIAVHHHPLPVNGWMDRHQWLNRQDFLCAIKELSQVKLVLYGHIHSAAETRYHHIQIQACPSSCWQWQHSADFAVADELPGFREITLNGDGHFSSQVYRTQE
ncbi:3',5'-cyclic adenosine monophosphate phosphodiesterase CpdA [Saliniradius amylolyticus]|uniref:3',5'-cyclic adenosine monophosphate phosphodiesterase CpdA n=1 Tax=Saliniradius amylolyticus TaxID=2183582 RepID=A0A2S2E0A8_9ALTE|nr:metallophosphoesterase [Saliniradius amylolyticus]AWL11081.1 3',5'-cyclic adenosine monophosphate phosphodiesterase CpdA [Saliniradius amylolyticus]